MSEILTNGGTWPIGTMDIVHTDAQGSEVYQIELYFPEPETLAGKLPTYGSDRGSSKAEALTALRLAWKHHLMAELANT